jgi:hypothetical protein
MTTRLSRFSSLTLRATRGFVHFVLPGLLLTALARHLSPFFGRASAVIAVGFLLRWWYRRRAAKPLDDVLSGLLPFVVAIAYVDVVWQLYNVGRMQVYADTLHGYLPLSEKSLLDSSFWLFGKKPFVTPAILKICGGDMAGVNDFFVGSYLLVTLFFLWALGFLFRDRTEKLLAFYLFVLLFLNQSMIGAWLTIAQSETPAMVATILTIAAYAYGYGRRDMWRRDGFRANAFLGLVVVSTVLFSFSRDTNLYFLPVLAVFYLLVFQRRRERVLVTCGIAAIFFLHSWTMERSGRWKFSLANVLFQRVIPDEELRSLFQERYDLPEDDLIMPAANHWASEEFENKKVLFDPDGDGADWVSRHGLSAYKRFLLTHPRFAISEWYGGWNAYNANFYRWTLRPGRRYRLHPILHSFPGHISFLGATLVLVGGVLFLQDNPVLSLTALHAFIIGLVAYHGDAMEVERHLQQAAMTLRFSYLLLLPHLYGAIRSHIETAVAE